MAELTATGTGCAAMLAFGVHFDVVRPKEPLPRQDEHSVSICAQQGSIWGTPESREKMGFSDTESVPNILCTDIPSAETVEVFVTVENHPQQYGEQAGLLFYESDLNYVKLVREGMKDGSVKLVLALQTKGEPEVVAKVNGGDGTSDQADLILRVTRLEDGFEIEGQTRLGQERISIGRCILTGIRFGRFGLIANSAPVGVEAWARFSNFELSDN